MGAFLSPLPRAFCFNRTTGGAGERARCGAAQDARVPSLCVALPVPTPYSGGLETVPVAVLCKQQYGSKEEGPHAPCMCATWPSEA